MILSLEHAYIRLEYLQKRLRELPEGHVHMRMINHKRRKFVYIRQCEDHPEYKCKYFGVTQEPGKGLLVLIEESDRIKTEISSIRKALAERSGIRRKNGRLCRRNEPFPMDHSLFRQLQKVADSNTYDKPVRSVEHRGILMRSKGEKLIAAHLDELGYEYVYEPRLSLNKTIYPDFAVYIPEIDKVIFIEFMGAFGKDGYGYDAGERFRLLSSNGIINGRDVLYICETNNTVVDMDMLDAMINAAIMANTEVA